MGIKGLHAHPACVSNAGWSGNAQAACTDAHKGGKDDCLASAHDARLSSGGSDRSRARGRWLRTRGAGYRWGTRWARNRGGGAVCRPTRVKSRPVWVADRMLCRVRTLNFLCAVPPRLSKHAHIRRLTSLLGPWRRPFHDRGQAPCHARTGDNPLGPSRPRRGATWDRGRGPCPDRGAGVHVAAPSGVAVGPGPRPGGRRAGGRVQYQGLVAGAQQD